jgi:preprotein translocase subunit SecY
MKNQKRVSARILCSADNLMTIIIYLLLICVFTYVWKYITYAARETLLQAKRRFDGAAFADLSLFF